MYATPININGIFTKHGKIVINYFGDENGIRTSLNEFCYGPDKINICDKNIVEVNTGNRILAIYGEKEMIGQTDKIYAVFFDANGKEINRIGAVTFGQANKSIGFFTDGMINVDKIQFENEYGEMISIGSSIYVIEN